MIIQVNSLFYSPLLNSLISIFWSLSSQLSLHQLVTMLPSLASKRSKSDERDFFSNLPEFSGKGFYLFKAKFLAWLDDVLLNPKPKKSKANQNVGAGGAAGQIEGQIVNEEQW